MSKFKMIIIFILILLLAIIILQNPNTVMLHLLWWNIEMSVFAVPVIVVLSIALGYMIASINIRRKNKK